VSGQLQALGALGIALLVACTPEQSAEEQLALEPVVVYAAYSDREYLPALFEGYTKETGVAVIVRYGDTPGIVDDVIDSRVSPGADLLLVPSVAEIWRAAEEGALRPIFSEFVQDSVPAWLRDPDEYWVALSYRSAELVYDPDSISPDLLSSYEELAEAQFRGRICLSSAALPINRAVIAMLIDEIGVRDTELAVRGWIANLAMPAFDTEVQLIHAIESGDCAIGVVSSQAAALAAQNIEDSRIEIFTPAVNYSDTEAVGVARHAGNPNGALALLEWLLSKKTQTQHASHTMAFAAISAPTGTKNVSLVARHSEEAQKLAERARYR
jgi:iron(III) transport system substrate-binding protein